MRIFSSTVLALCVWAAASAGAADSRTSSSAVAAPDGRVGLTYTTSWIGNSFSGKSQWVLQDVANLYVDADGTVFTNVPWDEAGGNVQEYRDGKLIAMARHTHGWGYEGGEAVAANAKYLFVEQTVGNEGGGLKGSSWPAKGFTWSGVSRRLRGDISRGAPFEGGRGKEGAVLPGSFLPVIEAPEAKRGEGRARATIRGLAATADRLFVSSPFDDTVKVYDTETMRPVAQWKVERPDRISLAPDGRLWVLQRPARDGESWRVLCLGADGQPLPPQIEFERGVSPSAMCFDRTGRLLVADSGPDQDIKIYDLTGGRPKAAGTFGVRGGIFGEPVRGRAGERRFNRPRGIGADARGNVYVASSGSVAGGSTVLECYAPDGKLVWRVTGLTFVDLADLDPASDVDIYTKEEHFTLDYAKAPGHEWSYRGYTVDALRYPDDPRLHLAPTHVWVRQIEGRKLLFVSDMTGEFLHVYRFNEPTDGEIAIPSALFARRHIQRADGYPPHQPAAGGWLWRDANGNGRIDADEYTAMGDKDGGGMPEPDERGSIWSIGKGTIRCVPLSGFDTNGVPSWDVSKARQWQKPAELDEVRRVRYLPAQDLMLVGGNRGDDHNQHWKPMGPVLCAYDQWSTGHPALRWKSVLPYEKGARGHESAEPISFDVAGDYVFVAYTRGLAREGMKYAFVKMYRLSDVGFVGDFVPERELGEVGLLDLVESVRANRRSNGEYVVFLEDDAKAKVVMFRWKP